MNHTPTPWLIDDGTFVYKLNTQNINTFSFQIQGGYTDNGKKTTREELEANAAHILHCVNEHETIIQLIRDIESYDAAVGWHCFKRDIVEQFRSRMRDILTKENPS